MGFVPDKQHCSSPVGPYFKTGFKPISLLASQENVRAWPGGTGSYKLGGNYAPCFLPQQDAAKQGYYQNLWLIGDGDERRLQEVGQVRLL